MPVAETIGIVSGVVTVGSFLLGSVPDATSRVMAAHKQPTSKEMINSIDENVAFVLKILEDYGHLISAVELFELKSAYWQHSIKLKDLRTELEGQAANPVDTPPSPSKSLLKILRTRNQKKKQKMAKEKMMRETVERVFKTSVQAKVHARGVSDKARYRQLLGSEPTPVPPSLLSSSSTSTTTPSGSASPTLGPLPSANDSVLSLVFNHKPSALSQTVATAGAHVPAAAAPGPQGAGTAAIPLQRIQTTDTVHSAHTLVSPTPIAVK